MIIKKILVDANVLIDYAERVPYAVKFFNEVKRKGYKIYILEDVYAEAKTKPDAIDKIKILIEELIKYDLFYRVKATDEEKSCAEGLKDKCVTLLGYDLDRVDKKLIVIAKKRGLILFSLDKDLIKIAKTERVKII